MRKRLFALILCLCLFFSGILPVSAEEVVTADIVITSADEFLAFAENCRLDRYSENLTVSLETDIELRGTGFSGVPIFSGTFLGNGYTIAGVKISAEGSAQGLFRYLTEDAVVQDLRVHGEITPQGSRSTVGGIAGSNAGTIQNCSFTGTVSGIQSVGGIAGINTVTGIIENSTSKGSISGTHYVGGIAGKNNGVIRESNNTAAVNADSEQNTVSLSDLTMESLTNSEAANATTDIGGIAGMSSGVIRGCTNKGTVGYPYMGYNVGGIAGSQSGYLTDCENSGAVSGRKEVGGIVGQMEPVMLLQYDTDTLQILQGQLGTLDTLADNATGDLRQSSDTLRSQYDTLDGQIHDAKDALDVLTPGIGEDLPDADSWLAAQNTLSSSLSGMPQTVKGMGSTVQDTASSLTGHLNALSQQLNAISNTLSNPLANLGGSFTDISDQDTETDKTGKVENAINSGTVLADRNVGGITGAVAIENELDHEEDLEISGSSSLNFEGKFRAVILNCQNKAAVTGKKQNVGGIVGWQSMGLVRSSMNSGALEAGNADYVGGIAGMSSGYLRACYARCTLSGSTYVGGIAGSAAVVSDCRSMAKIDGGEKSGSILGARTESYAEDAEAVKDNYYLCVEKDHGGIDGISYDGIAQPLEKDAFLALEDLPEMFSRVSIRFVFADGTEKSFSIEPGSPFSASDIPEIPQKRNHAGSWDGVDDSDLTAVYFDMTFEVSYLAYDTVIRSILLRNGTDMPLLLIQGDFPLDEYVTTRELADDFPSDTVRVIEAWSYTVPENGKAEILRYCLPQEENGETFQIYVRNERNEWREVNYTVDGSYLVFAVNADDNAFWICEAPFDPLPFIWIGAAALVALILLLILLLWRRTKKKKIQQAESKSCE